MLLELSTTLPLTPFDAVARWVNSELGADPLFDNILHLLNGSTLVNGAPFMMVIIWWLGSGGGSLGMAAFAWSLFFLCVPRIYFDCPYPSDILGSAVIGMAIMAAALTLRVPRPVAVAFERLQERAPGAAGRAIRNRPGDGEQFRRHPAHPDGPEAGLTPPRPARRIERFEGRGNN